MVRFYHSYIKTNDVAFTTPVAEAATMVMMAVLAAAMTMAPVVRTCSAVFCVCMRFVWNHMSGCDMYALYLLVIILLIVF